MFFLLKFFSEKNDAVAGYLKAAKCGYKKRQKWKKLATKGTGRLICVVTFLYFFASKLTRPQNYRKIAKRINKSKRIMP